MADARSHRKHTLPNPTASYTTPHGGRIEVSDRQGNRSVMWNGLFALGGAAAAASLAPKGKKGMTALAGAVASQVILETARQLDHERSIERDKVWLYQELLRLKQLELKGDQ